MPPILVVLKVVPSLLTDVNFGQVHTRCGKAQLWVSRHYLKGLPGFFFFISFPLGLLKGAKVGVYPITKSIKTKSQKMA